MEPNGQAFTTVKKSFAEFCSRRTFDIPPSAQCVAAIGVMVKLHIFLATLFFSKSSSQLIPNPTIEHTYEVFDSGASDALRSTRLNQQYTNVTWEINGNTHVATFPCSSEPTVVAEQLCAHNPYSSGDPSSGELSLLLSSTDNCLKTMSTAVSEAFAKKGGCSRLLEDWIGLPLGEVSGAANCLGRKRCTQRPMLLLPLYFYFITHSLTHSLTHFAHACLVNSFAVPHSPPVADSRGIEIFHRENVEISV